MIKKRFISILALLMVAVTGAVAQSTYKVSENTEGNLVHLTVNVGASTFSATNGSRAIVNPSTGAFSFRNGDKLYVGYNGACVGTLDYSATTNNTYKFSGDLSLSQNGDQPLHFYYLGGYGEYVNQVDETQYIVDIYEQQFNPYPVISYGTSTTNYSESSNAYSTTLENQCALVEFTTNRILMETNFYIQGINNQVAIDFENNTLTPTHNQNSQISLYPESPTSRWAILLPNEEPVTVTVDAVGYNKINIDIPAIKKNDYLHGENAVRFELTAMEADDPLTIEAAPFTDGVIRVINPPVGMKYSKNNGDKIPIESDIEIHLEQFDVVQFYGNSKDYSNTKIVSGINMSLSGNIMSLVDEENFATITTMEGASFAGLFAGNTCGFEASGLLLPATTLSENCYSGMFAGCSQMSDTPVELPALTLAPGCYSNMFEGCGQISEAPHLPATKLVDRCYASMFYQCGTLENVTCLATTINGTDCTKDWLYEVSNPGTFTQAEGASFWTPNSSDGIPWGWTVNELNLTYEVTLTDGSAITALNDYTEQEIWVNYTRSFTDGKTSTVCLPFAYTKKEGDGSFYAFTNIEKVGNEYVATMTEPVSTTLTANTPYLYLPNATGNVDFGGAYTIPATLTAGSTTSNGWTFKGTYTGEEWETAPATPTYGFSAGDANDGIKQGQFVKVGDYVRIKPLRCYLENASFAGARGMTRAAAEPLPETIKVRLISTNGEVNAIGTLYTRTGEVSFDSEAWYTLDGKRLNAKPNTKGIYVNNGKKVVIK